MKKSRKLFLLFVIFSLFLSNILYAESANRYLPLDSEILHNPLKYSCGLIVVEIRGSYVLNHDKLSKTCSIILKKFDEFIAKQYLSKTHNKKFYWKISFLPEGHCSRCLNDMRDRFAERPIHQDVIGYTDLNSRYIFMISDYRDRDFLKTFVHELFHALSMHFGIYNNHPGDWINKTRIDERYALMFTEWLGLGR